MSPAQRFFSAGVFDHSWHALSRSRPNPSWSVVGATVQQWLGVAVIVAVVECWPFICKYMVGELCLYTEYMHCRYGHIDVDVNRCIRICTLYIRMFALIIHAFAEFRAIRIWTGRALE